MRRQTAGHLLYREAFVACDRNGEKSFSKPSASGNLLTNPGFEQDATGWVWLDWSKAWGPFKITDKIAHSGKKSAHLNLNASTEKPDKIIKGVMQTLKPEKFPDMAGGWYRVENWERGVPRQYLQFVVIAWEKFDAFPNYQLRYVLEGVATQPLGIRNARYTILTKTPEPKTGEWIYFEAPIKEHFQTLWGRVPQNYEKLNFFWEVRFDDKPREKAPIKADVYYDDLYIGSKKPK